MTTKYLACCKGNQLSVRLTALSPVADCLCPVWICCIQFVFRNWLTLPPLPICSHQQIIYLVVIKKQIMGEKINLKFVRPEHSSQINCLLGTNRGKRDENTLFFFNPGCYIQIASPTSGGSFLHNNAAYYCAINGIVMASATQGEHSAVSTLPLVIYSQH